MLLFAPEDCQLSEYNIAFVGTQHSKLIPLAVHCGIPQGSAG
jgi:hypothetical protein